MRRISPTAARYRATPRTRRLTKKACPLRRRRNRGTLVVVHERRDHRRRQSSAEPKEERDGATHAGALARLVARTRGPPRRANASYDAGHLSRSTWPSVANSEAASSTSDHGSSSTSPRPASRARLTGGFGDRPGAPGYIREKPRVRRLEAEQVVAAVRTGAENGPTTWGEQMMRRFDQEACWQGGHVGTQHARGCMAAVEHALHRVQQTATEAIDPGRHRGGAVREHEVEASVDARGYKRLRPRRSIGGIARDWRRARRFLHASADVAQEGRGKRRRLVR